MRWAAVASLVLASVIACGGRSEYFDDRGIVGSGGDGEAGEAGSSAASGGKGGSGGNGGDAGTGPAGFGGQGGFAATGGMSAAGGFGGQPAGAGGVGAVGGFGGFAGFGNIGGFSGSAGKGSSGFGGATPGNCLDCVISACDSAQECLMNPRCIEGAVCGAGLCTGDEDPLGCWIECFDGDATLALFALQAVLCLSENCTVACQG
jgi:hypothetical protein